MRNYAVYNRKLQKAKPLVCTENPVHQGVLP
ncbi:MAG: hypothetical protein RL701_1000 [Pseudomonadota bacterium]|jgi:hypothetical protein